MPKISHTTKAVRARDLIAGITKHLLKRRSIMIGGKTYAMKEIIALAQAQLDALDAVRRAHVALGVAVRDERAAAGRLREVESLLKRLILSEFGERSPQLTAFGWAVPKKPGPKTAAAKAAGAEKARATREARGTMGSRQRKRSEAARSRV